MTQEVVKLMTTTLRVSESITRIENELKLMAKNQFIMEQELIKLELSHKESLDELLIELNSL